MNMITSHTDNHPITGRPTPTLNKGGTAQHIQNKL